MTGASPSLSIEPDEVKALGRLAFDIASQCRDGYSSLAKDVQVALEKWRGNNADVFSTGWGEFEHGATEVWDALFELAAKLGVTAESLRAVDQEYAAGLSSLDLP
ncbi:WXG100 family type VII secretion target [Nocardia sp. NBC_00511]|uniref:WXG100 family type VII secretion target n=1 Tax=Nocardia sp. NBC_00511 TaxID=2903591 RepID=UPI0030E234A7